VFWSPDIYPQIINRIDTSKSITAGYLIFEWTNLTKEYVNNCKLMDYLLVPSSWAKDILMKHGIEESKIIIVRAGLAPEFSSRGFVQRDHRFNRRFLMVGKWEERKAHEQTLAHMIKILNDRPISLTCAIGDPFNPLFDFKSEVEKVVKKNNLDMPRYEVLKSPSNYSLVPSTLYYCPREILRDSVDMIQLYFDNDFLVIPSRAGAVELPLIEAQACGTIPIGMPVSGMADYYTSSCMVIKDNGLIPMRDNRWFKGPTDFGVWYDIDWNDFDKRVDDLAVPISEEAWWRMRELMVNSINCLCDYKTIVEEFWMELNSRENLRADKSRLGLL
jgi:glycosyltransferase involved in cell wall biosynthesis